METDKGESLPACFELVVGEEDDGGVLLRQRFAEAEAGADVVHQLSLHLLHTLEDTADVVELTPA